MHVKLSVMVTVLLGPEIFVRVEDERTSYASFAGTLGTLDSL